VGVDEVSVDVFASVELEVVAFFEVLSSVAVISTDVVDK
jgi:hypothetical protein